MGETRGYKRIHDAVSVLRGKARNTPCFLCGKTTRGNQWAYMHNAGREETVDSNSQKYGTDPMEHYESLCRSCHTKLDITRDEDWAEHVTTHGRSLVDHFKEMKRTDPEAYRRMTQSRANTLKSREKENPERYAAMRKAQSIAGKAQARRLYSTRFRCGECDLVSTSSGVALHQKSSTHSGRTRYYGKPDERNREQ